MREGEERVDGGGGVGRGEDEGGGWRGGGGRGMEGAGVVG